jgi:hypothetical protein
VCLGTPFGSERPKKACDNRRLTFYYQQAMEFAFPSWENRATPKVFGPTISVLMTPTSPARRDEQEL